MNNTIYHFISPILKHTMPRFEPGLLVMCFRIMLRLRLHLSQQRLEHYIAPCEHYFSRHPQQPLRYHCPLSASPVKDRQ